MQKKILLPALLGNVLEYYDFCLYGYFASIIAKLLIYTPPLAAGTTQ